MAIQKPLLEADAEAPVKEKKQAATNSESSTSGNLKKLALPVFIPQIPAWGVNALINPVLPGYVMTHYGVTAATAGMAASCLNVSSVIFDMPQNIIADRVGPHALGIFSGFALVLAGAVGIAADRSSILGVLLLARLFAGMGQSTWQMSRILLLARAPPTQRSDSLAAMGATQRLGNMLFPMLGSFLFERCSIESVFLAQSFMGFVVLPLAALPVLAPATKLIPDYIKGSGLRSGKQASVSGMLRCLFKNCPYDYATAGTSMLVCSILRQAKDFLIVLKLRNLHASGYHKGLAITMAYVFDFSCSPGSAWLMKRGRKLSLGPAIFAIGSACGLLGTPLADSIPAVIVIACLAGAGNGISSGVGMAIGTDIAVRREREGRTSSAAEFLGPWREIQDLGLFLGPSLSGAIITALSFESAAVLMFVIGCIFTLFMVVFVEESVNKI